MSGKLSQVTNSYFLQTDKGGKLLFCINGYFKRGVKQYFNKISKVDDRFFRDPYHGSNALSFLCDSNNAA